MRRDRRQRTLRAWRARRSERGLDTVGGMQFEMPPRTRRRHRAPTPRILPAGGRGYVLGARVVAAVAVAGVIAACGLWVWRSPALRVAAASVNGNARVSAEEIFAASGLEGRHYAAINWHDAAAAIEEVGGVRSARVRPRFPGGVQIEVTETLPLLLWSGPTGTLAIDEDGLAVPAVGELDALLRVTDTVGLARAAGDRIDAGLVLAALQFGQRLTDLQYTSEHGFVGTDASGMRVRLGQDPTIVPLQLALLDVAAGGWAQGGGRAAVLDLRYPTRPYYRVQEEVK